MNDEFVGMFWVVNNDLWLRKTPLDDFRKTLKDNFKQRKTITYRQAHVVKWTSWCKEFDYDQREEHFMYHPRGRISYFPGSDKFELVIDPCLKDNTSLVDKILDECGLNRENTFLVTQSDDQSLHYVCHKCKPESFDECGRYIDLA